MTDQPAPAWEPGGTDAEPASPVAPDGGGGPAVTVDDRAGAGSLSRAQAQRDVTVRRWGVVTPSATVIGRAERPEDDLPESVRRLHDEQHAATAGYSTRAHYLDRLRTTQALCNAIDVTPWQRDVALGIMSTIDLTAFGSRRAIPTVALVVIRHVVDVERRSYLGLDDLDPGDLSEERLEALFERYKDHDIAAEPAFERLADQQDLDKTSLNRLRRVLKEQLDGEDVRAFGRDPFRDPNLPSVRDRPGADGPPGDGGVPGDTDAAD